MNGRFRWAGSRRLWSAGLVAVAASVTMAVPGAANHNNGPECKGVPATHVGTGSSDNLSGTGGRDVFVGRGGDDTFRSDGGKDLLCGGRGDDTLRGGSNDDGLAGGRGDDTLRGDGGNDRLEGNRGQDDLDCGAGNDDDESSGGSGNDSVQDCELAAGHVSDPALRKRPAGVTPAGRLSFEGSVVRPGGRHHGLASHALGERALVGHTTR